MIKIYLIGFSTVAINVVLQAIATTYWTSEINNALNKWKDNLTKFRIIRILIFSFLLLTLLHVIHSLIWAGVISLIPDLQADFKDFEEIVYYSLVTFTTLGYGDLTINSEWRIFSGIEAINGIMLIGWSTALMYSLIQNIYKVLRGNNG